jgi:hypothetical protein
MLYEIAAELVICFHLVWIGFLIFGAMLAYKRPWLRALHLAGLAFSITMQGCRWYCPLTYVEQWLRSHQHPDVAYTGSFIAHYAERLVYLRVSPSLILGLTLVICAGTAYIYIAWRPPARKATALTSSSLADADR